MDLSSIGVSARELMSWQEKLANTAVQRQVADMKAAGINPVLSAKFGGADVPSGATDLAQLASLGGSSGSSGVGSGVGTSLPGGVSIGDYISALNPNGTTRIGKVSIPNWLLQWGYNKAVEIYGDNPGIAGILGVTPGAENVNPGQAESAIINNASYGELTSEYGNLTNGGMHTGRIVHSWKEDQKQNNYNWFAFHKKYPNVKYWDYVKFNFSYW